MESPNVFLLAMNSTESYAYDIDKDGNNDFELVSMMYFKGGMYSYASTFMKLYPGCGVIIDSTEVIKTHYTMFQSPDSSYNTDYYYENIALIRPKALDQGSIINKNADWYHDDVLTLNSRRDQYVDCVPPYDVYNSEYQLNWFDQAGKYIGIRKITEADTIYSWLKLSFDNPGADNVRIEKIGYR